MTDSPTTPSRTERSSVTEQVHAAREEDWIRRERRYIEKIKGLSERNEALLEKRDGWIDSDTQLERIKTLHRTLLNGVGGFRDSAKQAMDEQQKDLVRAFRVRLDEVQGDLRVRFTASEQGETSADNVFARQRAMTQELDETHSQIAKLEKAKKRLVAENGDLADQLDEKASDRAFLIDQLKAVRKDNEKLRLKISSGGAQLEEARMGQAQSVGGGGGGGSRNPGAAGRRALKKAGNGRSLPIPAEPSSSLKPASWATNFGKDLVVQSEGDHLALQAKLKETIGRQQTLLQVERRTSRDLQRQLERGARERTELELFLRQCVKDVQDRVVKAQQRAEAPRGAHTAGIVKRSTGQLPALPPIQLSALGKQQRLKVVEELLSKERVLRLLFERTFPASDMPATLLFDSVAERRSATHLVTGASSRGGTPRKHS